MGSSRTSSLYRLFGWREDPYAGADAGRARKLGGVLWVASTVFGAILLPLSPPTEALGPSGWFVAGGLLAAGLAHGVRMLKHPARVSNNELYVASLVALAVIAGMEWLAGGRDTPWPVFFMVAVVYTACTHPPRRVAAYLGVYLAATSASAFHSGGWSAAEAGEVGLQTLFNLGIGLLGMVLMDGVRRQRTSLAAEGEEARQLAHEDSLTGLGNRRRLMVELEAQMPTASMRSPLTVALYDLDGFKSYNDTYGHVAGDALLIRLGEKLATAVGADGDAFRMGGDEFCVTSRLPEAEAEALVLRAREALAERGEGFAVEASYGWTLIESPETSISDALRAADRAMYARKSLGRASAGRQSTDVLTKAMAERNSDLGVHVHDVRDLCGAVADELGLEPEEKAPLLQAASLHDIGKVAIPDAILHKPGPLTDEEWAFMRRHTILGERILSAAPALVEASKLVRSSHERFDGCGYPDRLAGEDIPLGARVIAVCDAYDAMISPRPYRTAVTPDQAVAELSRCAGSQFDPQVVEAFRAVYRSRTGEGDLVASA